MVKFCVRLPTPPLLPLLLPKLDASPWRSFAPLALATQAAQRGHCEMIALLHRLGANVLTPKKNGVSPVFVAAQQVPTPVGK